MKRCWVDMTWREIVTQCDNDPNHKWEVGQREDYLKKAEAEEQRRVEIKELSTKLASTHSRPLNGEDIGVAAAYVVMETPRAVCSFLSSLLGL